jgi:hypothetical protein
MMVRLFTPIKNSVSVSSPLDSSPQSPRDLDYLFTPAKEQNTEIKPPPRALIAGTLQLSLLYAAWTESLQNWSQLDL